jgi:hypothetical protein
LTHVFLEKRAQDEETIVERPRSFRVRGDFTGDRRNRFSAAAGGGAEHSKRPPKARESAIFCCGIAAALDVALALERAFFC